MPITFRQNTHLEGEWVATLNGKYNAVGWCKDCAVRNLHHWMRENQRAALIPAQSEFDEYFRGEKHQRRPEPELQKRRLK